MKAIYTIATLVSIIWHGIASAGAMLPSVAWDKLALEDAQALLLRNNRDIRSAQRVVEGLKADALSAAQRPNPNFSINSSSISLDHANSGKPWDKPVDTVFRIEQPIERGGKRALRVTAAEQAVQAGTADASDSIRRQRLALSASYYDLYLAQNKENINRQAAQLYKQSVAAAEKRLEAGDIAAADLARLQVEALRAENEARQSQAERERSQYALASMLGVEERAAEIRASGPWPEISPLSTPIGKDMLDCRDDVRSARMRVHLAETRRSQARALLSRDLSVGVQYEHFPPDNRNSIGVGISIPLFVSYQFEGEIRRAESDYADALENLEKTEAQALTEISQARADLHGAEDRLRRYQNGLLDKAKQAAAAAELAYRHGAQSLLELLDAQRTLHATRLDMATAEADYAKAFYAWRFIAPSNAEESK